MKVDITNLSETVDLSSFTNFKDMMDALGAEALHNTPKDYADDIRPLAGSIGHVYDHKGFDHNYEYIHLEANKLGSEKNFMTPPDARLSYILNDNQFVTITRDFENNQFVLRYLPAEDEFYCNTVEELVDMMHRKIY